MRMAMGAAGERVLRLVVTEGVALAAVGLVLGLAASLALARLLTTILFGVEPFDPLTLLGVAAVVLAVAGVSCLIPAMRAAKVEPASSMR